MTPIPASDKEKRPIAGTSGPIAYLTSQYPASSHTFIRREIAELREKGLDILTYSIRKPVSGLDHPMDIEAKDQTFYVLGQGATRHISAHGAALFRHPSRYFKTLKRAMQHRVPGGKALLWSLFHFVESITLADQLRADNVSHLHNHFANSAANVGMLAAYFGKIPWSMTLHGISETDYPAGLLLGKRWQRLNLWRACHGSDAHRRCGLAVLSIGTNFIRLDAELRLIECQSDNRRACPDRPNELFVSPDFPVRKA
ncbi:hypothetical protein [Parasphingorhabdus sp.]|uniref:hypothetical protein n=1 Tax=Parasphingorhabdus sp. TaxID=2709688 RepID=UPI003BAF5CC9